MNRVFLMGALAVLVSACEAQNIDSSKSERFVMPTEYRNAGTGALVPVTGTIPVSPQNSAIVSVPPDVNEVLVTASAPGVDLEESDLHVEQSVPGNAAAMYDPRGLGWVPLQPNVWQIALCNDQNLERPRAFFVYYSVAFR